MKKPLIGITVNYDTKDQVGLASCMGIAGQDWNFIYGDYVYAIEKAGGLPVLLPRLKNNKGYDPILEKLDGVLLSGGHDVDPRTYGERMLGVCGSIIPERDQMDLYIARYAVDHKKALLAICRGIQILNVAIGGTLYQDLESQGDYLHHFMSNSPRQYPVHEVQLTEGSTLAQIYGKTEISVNSYHHQAVKEPGKIAKVTALSDDHVIEAIEVKEAHPFTIGVQWHPEMMFDSEEQGKIFKAFVEAAAE